MQITKVNGQSSIQNHTSNGSDKPSFGMKIYLDKALVSNINLAMDTLVLQAGEKNVRITDMQIMVKNFLKNLSKSIAEHNAKPQNHELFDNDLEIKHINIRYGKTKIVDSVEPKIDVSELQPLADRMKNCDEVHGVDNWKRQMSFEFKLDNDIENSHKAYYEPYIENKLPKVIQDNAINHIEFENPDVYLDMIQPPKVFGKHVRHN